MKSKELKSHNLPSDDILVSSIDAKPNILFILLIIVAIFFYFTSVPVFYSTSLIIISIIVLLFMPRVTLMEFFQDYLVMYNKADKNTCVLIYYDEVASWHYSWSTSRDYLYIELEDGSVEKIEAFSKTLFEANMNRFLKEKKKSGK